MILLIDNYDSFVHNLARYLERLGQERSPQQRARGPEEHGDKVPVVTDPAAGRSLCRSRKGPPSFGPNRDRPAAGDGPLSREPESPSASTFAVRDRPP